MCWPPVGDGDECFDADILAGFDLAIHDGVHVLSVSLGGDPTSFFNDSVAIGSFHAMKHGIAVVCSAGNSGPFDGTVSNMAPWQITVGASTFDREFPSYVVLANNVTFKVGPLFNLKFASWNCCSFIPLMLLMGFIFVYFLLKGQSLSATVLPYNKHYPLISAAAAKAANVSAEDA